MAESLEKTGFFLGATESDFLCCLTLREMKQPRWFLSLVEQLIERNLKGAGQLLQGFDGRNGVAVLGARNVGTLQSTTLFDVPLGQLSRFPEGADMVADEHDAVPCGIIVRAADFGCG